MKTLIVYYSLEGNTGNETIDAEKKYIGEIHEKSVCWRYWRLR